ncbi:Uncharacterised protein [Leminorella grimontii]|nr:Uncharacterised protein [Leminorella grimontii]
MKLRVLLSSVLILTAMQAEARTMADIQQIGDAQGLAYRGTTHRWPIMTPMESWLATTSIWRKRWQKI